MTFLSIIVAGRNDNYGGDFLNRMQDSVNTIFDLAKKHDLKAEYVFIDWGSSWDRPGMEDAISWVQASIPVRIIKVPPNVVRAIENPDGTFLDAWAKNVGIRRARGEYVLTTNSDDIYSDEMIEFLAKEELDSNSFYRIDLLGTENGQVVKVYRAPSDTLHYGAAGDFILMSREKYHEIRGWPEVPYYNSVDSMAVHSAGLAGLKQVILPYAVYHPEHLIEGRKDWSKVVKPWDDYHPHTFRNDENWGLANMEFEEVRIN